MRWPRDLAVNAAASTSCTAIFFSIAIFAATPADLKVRNSGEMLKRGMFVDVNFGGAAATSEQAAVSVPRGAVQMLGAKQVVFVVTDTSGVFVQREVSAGPGSNGVIPTQAGLNAGERVVTEGSFLLRAESLKLNPVEWTCCEAESLCDSKLTREEGG